ncbi:MAG: GAF domain-containing SpoIIE family protein phosphatase [Pseudomonadota bacterium]
MKDTFYRQQEEITLKNLDLENKRLRQEINRLREVELRNKTILDFHDKLEKDFFSADTLENLIIKLMNCLQLRPDIDFVSLCLTSQYMGAMIGSEELEMVLPVIGVPSRLKYLSIIDNGVLSSCFGDSMNTLFEKTPGGSAEVFFPGHGDEVRSHAIIPLILRRQIIGSLNIGSIITRHYYSTETGPDLLDRLSSKLAIAIDNILSHNKLTLQKEIIDREIHSAALLQKSLLPSSPLQSEALKITAFFQPCRKLGGDFYDFIPLSHDKTAIIIADVSGHGFSAALIAAMLKFSLQLDNLENRSPMEIVSNMNQKFCQILKKGDYITLCYGLIDTHLFTLNLVRAGHPYPILYRAKAGEILELKPSGPPLGVDREAVFQELTINLSPEDMILLYTDGLTDSVFDRARPDALNRLISSLGEKYKAPELLERLSLEIKGLLQGKELKDDTSLLIASLS